MSERGSEYWNATCVYPPVMRGLFLTLLNPVFNCPDYLSKATLPLSHCTSNSSIQRSTKNRDFSLFREPFSSAAVCQLRHAVHLLIYLNLSASINHREWGHLQVTTDNLNQKYREKLWKASGSDYSCWLLILFDRWGCYNYLLLVGSITWTRSAQNKGNFPNNV